MSMGFPYLFFNYLFAIAKNHPVFLFLTPMRNPQHIYYNRVGTCACLQPCVRTLPLLKIFLQPTETTLSHIGHALLWALIIILFATNDTSHALLWALIIILFATNDTSTRQHGLVSMGLSTVRSVRPPA